METRAKSGWLSREQLAASEFARRVAVKHGIGVVAALMKKKELVCVKLRWPEICCCTRTYAYRDAPVWTPLENGALGLLDCVEQTEEISAELLLGLVSSLPSRLGRVLKREMQ